VRWVRHTLLFVNHYGTLLDKSTMCDLSNSCGNFGVGWPGNGGVEDAPPIWSPYDRVRDAMRNDDVLGLHGYWPVAGPAYAYKWLAGRHEQCPWQCSIILGECGLDDAVAPGVRALSQEESNHWEVNDYIQFMTGRDRSIVGMRAQGLEHFGFHGLSPNHNEACYIYLEQLKLLDAKLANDWRVQDAMPFTYDFSHPWSTFNTRTDEFMRVFLEYVKQVGGTAGSSLTPTAPGPPYLPPITPPSTEVDVFDLDGNRHAVSWLTENYGISINSDLLKEGTNTRIVQFKAKETLGHQHDNVTGYYSVRLIDENDDPLIGWSMGRTWPDASNGWPNVSAPDNVIYPPGAKEHAVFSITKESGYANWVAGPGDITHNKDGVNKFWCPSHEFGGDVMCGAGLFVHPTGKMIVWVPTFQLLKTAAAPVPIPPVEPPITPIGGIRVRTNSGIVTLSMEEYLLGVIPAEMPAEWNLQALMAQAVLARSYATWYTLNPASVNYDIGSTNQYQVYDPDKLKVQPGDSEVHANYMLRMQRRIIDAEAATRGIVLRDKHGVLRSEYKARCGREMCPECQGEVGTNGQHWPDNACQYGIKELADDGIGWRTIAKYYYKDVYLSDEVPPSGNINITAIRWHTEEAVRDYEKGIEYTQKAHDRLVEHVIPRLYELEF